ncbi:hypothetical protein [Maridesulfovibrio salexigens]|uniref:Uncharacterized protein n=1 Tax=Maridesulfovibrio salexigens (strain ATCC 14822 / DSM 2638 / NCIMB 8403 / VKM B-1763) TaxID=526222 RepID=C6BRQ5_MARSD|nr:hypothetical protein [Maridesulfovibrio salexigens]ACS79495.1 hypothetical protein Desal_1433 [Maridesulfovibrio salexigens DSM 2638]
MDKVVDKLVGLGVPGLVLLIVMASTGLAGAAALTAALAALGGPFGMLGGLAVLGLLVMLSSSLTEYGVDALAKAVIDGLTDKGETKDSIIEQINNFPLISSEMKGKLRDHVNYA